MQIEDSEIHPSSVFLAVFTLLALAAYVIPWVVNPGMGLTLGAYDLAEWASLHPEVRNASPALLTSLLLRLPLMCLAVIIGFASPTPALRTSGWYLMLALLLFLVASSLPPLEFFTEARGDTNYQQQFWLTLGALVGGIFGLTGVLPKLQAYVVMFFSLFGAFTGLAGLLEARRLMIGFSMPVSVGIGPVALMLVLGVMFIMVWRGYHLKKPK